VQTPTSQPDTADRPLRDSNVVDEWLADGSMVLFHTNVRLLVTLNPTGALVWEHCDGTCTVAEIEAQLRSVYPGVPTIGIDVAAILEQLRERGMVSPNRSPIL
jgi:hypothetical protein